jgi:MFS family permease
MALIGLTTILPIYAQGVLGRTPIEASLTLTTLVFGWPLAVMLSGRLYRIFGIRTTARVGSFIFPLGALFLLFLTSDSGLVLASVGSFLMGFGMGIISITGIVLVQESVEWSMRGSATSSIIFSRSLGNTLGATALGAVLSVGIRHYYAETAGTRLQALADMNGKQPGDPARTAEAMIKIPQVDNPPRHLVLGALAFEYATMILKGRVDEFEKWRDLSLGADFPAA